MIDIQEMIDIQVSFLNREGTPISEQEFMKYITDTEYKIIKQEEINDYFVSTVWTGLNYGKKRMH